MTETPPVNPLHVVILAAGKGTRMRSAMPKVLHRLAGLPMLDHVIRAARTLAPASMTVVVGHDAERLRQHLAAHPGVQVVVQEPQLGTGHALLQAEPVLAGQADGTVLLLSGDVPALTTSSLRALVAAHDAAGAAVTVMTAHVDRPYGYGRIVRAGHELVRIVEERDASPAERDGREVNAGVYAFALAPLFDALRGIGAQNAQGEYYLPDLVGIYRRQRQSVASWTVANPGEIRGINSRSELAEVSRMVRQQKNEELMAAGVTLVDPATTYVDVDVQVGADTVIHPGVHLEGSTRVGAACEIHAGSRLVNAVLGDRVTVLNHCVIADSEVGDGCSVGPFAHLRPGSALGSRARVGNFVELKKTKLGSGAKANHLSYLGDTTVGDGANIGAGTITCNYDGQLKHETTIGAGAFVGSNSTLVAPVRIGDQAYVGAGSAITEDVPADALALGRSRQENKPGWVSKRRASKPQP